MSEQVDRMRKLRAESEDMGEFAKKLIDEDLAVSMSMGRRLWFQLEPKDKIVNAAMMHEGKMWTGRRHYEIIRDIVEGTGVSRAKGEQGFVTDKGKFVNRSEALKIAISSGQVEEGKTINRKHLFSEDLW